MDTEKQRQRRRDDARLTKSGNARSEQLHVVPAESLTNREWLPGELLSGSERRRPVWFLDMKYQTCCSSVCYLQSNTGQGLVKLVMSNDIPGHWVDIQRSGTLLEKMQMSALLITNIDQGATERSISGSLGSIFQVQKGSSAVQRNVPLVHCL